MTLHDSFYPLPFTEHVTTEVRGLSIFPNDLN